MKPTREQKLAELEDLIRKQKRDVRIFAVVVAVLLIATIAAMIAGAPGG